jgi:hypothetical protein
MAFEGVWGMYFSEGMMQELGLDFPYQLVTDGKWTMEKLNAYSKEAANLNGDQSFKYDINGNATYGEVSMAIENGRLYAFGVEYVARDENGRYQFTADTDPKFTQAWETLIDYHGSGDGRFVYGNNKDLPDAIAKDLVEFITQNVHGRSNSRDGGWGCGFHVARMSYTQGALTAASANGRPRGEELSKNISASMGQNREGATAAILSATKIDATSFTSDAALDLGLLPSAVSGEDGLEAMYGLLMTFVRRNGHAMHINVFQADTLRDAQAHPEKYQDLQIRVCGWNVLWNNICKEEQDGFIRQAESLI